MRHKLALTIALAGFCVVTALGVGMAGASPAQNPLTGTEGILPSAPPSTTPASPPCPRKSEEGKETETQAQLQADKAESECSAPPPGTDSAEPETPTTPSVTAPSPEAPGGVHLGATINGNPTRTESHKGAAQNQRVGSSRARGAGTNGGISFPSATGGGEQPPPNAPSGGQPFSSGGSPTPANPTTTITGFGPARIGAPNFVINSFQIPPFLLPIYQACGTQYGIPWEVLASINKIETDFGSDLNVSSAGAEGWMQFLPSTWATYGVDANGDGRKDPYNPVDAICAAANYLHAAGGSHDIYKAVLAYNHASWYAQEVLATARAYGKLPENLVGSLTGLTEGAHFPVAADSRYADEISTHQMLRRATPGARSPFAGSAETISSSPTRRGINIFSHSGAPIVAVNDGVIKAVGRSRRLGHFIVLEDAYGNRYTYAELGQIARTRGGVLTPNGGGQPLVNAQNLRPRMFALPARRRQGGRTVLAAHIEQSHPPLAPGTHVTGGTVIGFMGTGAGAADPHINFAIRPAGQGASRIDPKPILDGWKLLEATAIYRADGKDPFSHGLGVSAVLLLSRDALQKRVLADHKLSLPACARHDIATGGTDRRVLALLEYLVAKGYRLKVSSLQCGTRESASSNSVAKHGSEESIGISAIDGTPVSGHQGPGSPTDSLIKAVLALQGAMRPQRVVSAENLPGPVSFARHGRRDRIQIGYLPSYGIDYVSPFLNATTGRIDQGVDFTGTGPILAVGDAEILQTGAPGWPEGGGVLYRLLNGPRAGAVIYVFEGARATVHSGQRVSAGQQIALFVPGGSIEMGFANAAGVPLSHAEYSEGVETVWGHKMAAFLAELGGASSLSPSLGHTGG
ncbi:MAG: lytic murein transglycosylase [Solirubrobacterales bacterium]